MPKFDITTMTDEAFYGEKYVKDGYYARTVHNVPTAAAKVWLEILDNTRVPVPGQRGLDDVFFEATPFEEVKVGDLLAAEDMTSRNSWTYRPSSTRDSSVAEWVSRSWNSPALYVVTKRTAKRITVVHVANPATHFTNDFSLDIDNRYDSVWGDSSNRFLKVLGNVEALRKAAEEAPSMGRWERVHKAAVAAAAEHDRRFAAERQAEKDAAAAAVAPYKPVAKALNKALGHKVFTYTADGVERRSGWKAVPTSFLKAALSGAGLMGNDTDLMAVEALLDQHAVVEG